MKNSNINSKNQVWAIFSLLITFSFSSCLQTEAELLATKALIDKIQEKEKEEKEEKKKKEKEEVKKEKEVKKPKTSDSTHTLSNDISFLPSFYLDKRSYETVSLNHKVGDKYVSSRIILKNFNVEESVTLLIEDINVEIYRSSLPLETKRDKENRFQSLNKNNFKLYKGGYWVNGIYENNKLLYTIESLKEGDYTLILVHSSEVKFRIVRR